MGLTINQEEYSAWEHSEYGTVPANYGNAVWSYVARALLGSRQEHNWTRILDDSSPGLSALYVASGPLLFGGNAFPRRDQYLLEKILAVKQPVIILGVGVLRFVKTRADCRSPLSNVSKSFFKIIESRISEIGGFEGLRGECFQQILRLSGFSDRLSPIGCPSLFMNREMGLGRRL